MLEYCRALPRCLPTHLLPKPAFGTWLGVSGGQTEKGRASYHVQNYSQSDTWLPQTAHSAHSPRNYYVHRLRNTSDFRLPRSRTRKMQTSYIPSTLRLWNTLSPEISNVIPYMAWNQNLNRKRIPWSNSTLCTRHLSLIRLGFSKLKLHLFTRGIVPVSFLSKELPLHYFLQCPSKPLVLGRISAYIPQFVWIEP